MKRLEGNVAIVTGASSGFGEAIARALAKEGCALALGARRVDRLEKLTKELEGEYQGDYLYNKLDVRDVESVGFFVAEVIARFKKINILINNAGLALGREHLAQASEDDWNQMMETNYMGAFRMSKAAVPHIVQDSSGHIINIGSIASHIAYEGGGGYCASKFALRAMTQALRIELVEKAIRVTSIDPGAAETEFSIVRYQGDLERAKKVYDGIRPLTSIDVAECVVFALTRPSHVNIDDIILTPTDQVGAVKVKRTK